MQAKDFIKFLTDNNVSVFKLDDAIKIMHCNRSYAILFLYRCAQRNLIGHINRGTYYLKSKSNEYEIASNILGNSYVSLISALSYYGLTTQIPRIVYVVSTNRHRPIKNIMGVDIVFRKIKKEMLFGYHKEQSGNLFIADPEKAIVDIYYFNDVNDLDDSALENPPRIDVKKLAAYAERSERVSVMHEVSKLLKEHGYAALAKKLLNTAEIVR